MTKPMLLAEFTRLPPTTRAVVLDGLSGAIDLVAEAAPETHRFLRYQWFAAALAAYGGSARTILVERDGDPVIALPMISFGPGLVHLAAVPGGPRPFRSFPVSLAVAHDAFRVLVDSLGHEVNALRIGPVQDGDPAMEPLLAAARAKGWTTLDRLVADRAAADMSTAIGEENGIAAADAGVRGEEHDAFWRDVATDPVLAEMVVTTLSPGARSGLAMREWMLVRPGLPALLGRALGHVWARGGAR
jgi:hypothetical protein